MKLDVILRTCKRSNINKNSSLERICGEDRDTMMAKCIKSLIHSINISNHDVKLTILDDHSESEFLVFLDRIVLECNKQVEIIYLNETGVNLTLLAQIEKARDADELVYIVEDDYLHEQNAIDHMINAYFFLLEKYKMEILIHPFDDPFRYIPGREEPTFILYDGVRYWRQITKTTMCILTHSRVLKNNFNVFKELALGMPRVWEGETINTLYKDLQTGKGSVLAWCPIPSIAYHLAYVEPLVLNTDHLSWKTLWNKE